MIKRSHGNDSLAWKEPLQDVNYLLNESVTDLDGLLAKISKWLHLVNVQVSVASTIEFVVYLEQPGVHIEVVSY